MLKHEATLTGHDDRVWCVAWHPNGNLLASCSTDKTIKLWSNINNEWKCVDTLTDGHTRTIRNISWSPCGTKLASASFDASITIWKKKYLENTYEIVTNLEGHENEVKSTAWSSNGEFLASCSRDKSVWIWDVCEDYEFECSSVLSVHNQDVKHVVWHPHKNILASTSYDNTIRLFSQSDDDWMCFATLESHDSTVWSCDFNSSGDKLVSCSDDKTIKVWKGYTKDNKEGIVVDSDVDSTWKCICTIRGFNKNAIYDIKWCNLTNLIATASGDNSIAIYKFDEENNNLDKPMYEQVACELNAHTQDCNSIAWNPKQSGLLASASDDGTIKLWKFVNE